MAGSKAPVAKASEEIAHHYNDEAEERFGKFMKYKRHEETRITRLLQRHFPMSKMAGYNLAQDKIIYLWMFRGLSGRLKLRKMGRNSLRKKSRLRRAPGGARRSLNIF